MSHSSKILSFHSFPSFSSYPPPNSHNPSPCKQHIFFINNVSGHMKVTGMHKRSRFYSSPWVRVVEFVLVLFSCALKGEYFWQVGICQLLLSTNPPSISAQSSRSNAGWGMCLPLSATALWYSSDEVLLQEHLPASTQIKYFWMLCVSQDGQQDQVQGELIWRSGGSCVRPADSSESSVRRYQTHTRVLDVCAEER